MKDIADAAHVSTATVSYILNNVKNQKISDKTRDRVLDICRKMGYLPNLTARTLASRKSGLIGILTVKNLAVSNPWQDFFYSKFVSQLELLLLEHGYHIIITGIDTSDPELNIILQRELEGVFMLDVDESMFYRVSQKFSVPVVIVDGYFDDNLFHKIVLDYKSAIENAKKMLHGQQTFLIANKSNNKGVRETIYRTTGLPEDQICFADTEEELAAFASRHKGCKGIVINEFLGLFAARYIDPNDLVIICTCESPSLLPHSWKTVQFGAKKAKTAAHVLLSYIKGSIPESNDKYTLIPVASCDYPHKKGIIA